MAWINEIYDTLYDPNTICVACISHGKDSNAMLRAIKLLGLPLHRIVTSDVWATQDIPADLPNMWEWKKKADQTIKELYGIEVEHVCAMQKPCSQNSQVERERQSSHTRICSTQDCKAENTAETSTDFLARLENGAKSSKLTKLTYEDIFYRRFKEGRKEGRKETCTDLRRCTTLTAEENSRIYGFPMRGGNWCTTYLKSSLRISDFGTTRTMVSTTQTQSLFSKPRERGAKNKYRSVSWHCG